MITLCARVAIYAMVAVGFYQTAISVPQANRLASAVLWPISVGSIIGQNIPPVPAQ